MKIERHVFGSRTGYTTLARSTGLSASDCRTLEVFAFGQTSDRGYLQSLAKVPAYISRPLKGNRRAITRVFPGQADNKGRNTLLLVSIVVDNSDWIGVLKGDVLPLLGQSDMWQWDGTPQLASLNVAIPGPNPLALEGAEATEIVGLISEIERLCATKQNVVISEPKYALTTVRAIEMLIPDSAKLRFSCAARSLSANLDVNLNCVARGVGVSSVGPGSQVYRPRTDGILSPYAAELVRGKIMQGQIPRDVIRSYRGFGAIEEEIMMAEDVMPAQQSRLPDPHGHAKPRKRKRKPMSSTQKTILGFCIFALIAGSVIGYGIYRKSAAKALQQQAQHDRETNAQEAAKLCNMESRDFVRESAADRNKDLNDAGRVASEIEDDSKASTEAKANARALPGWRKKMTVVHNKLVEIDDKVFSVDSTLDGFLSGDKFKQLSEEDYNKLRTDIDWALNLENYIITDEIKLSETILKSKVDRLSSKARNMNSRIDKLDSEYGAFISRMEAEKGKDTDLLPQNIKTYIQDIDQWKKTVHADPDKVQRLDGLGVDFNEIKERLEQLKSVMNDLRGIIEGLKKTNKAALKRYQSVVNRAKPFNNAELRSLLLVAEIEKAEADKSEQKSQKQNRTQKEVLLIVGEMGKFLREPATDQKKVKEKILRHIKVLRGHDENYANDLRKIFERLQDSFEQKQKA